MVVKIVSLVHAAAIALALSSVAPTAALAQELSPEAEAVVSGCSGGGDCVALVNTYVAGLRAANLSAAQINDALSALSAALAEASQDAVTARSQIAAGMRAAAAEISDADTRQQVEVAANTVSAGDPGGGQSASGA